MKVIFVRHGESVTISITAAEEVRDNATGGTVARTLPPEIARLAVAG